MKKTIIIALTIFFNCQLSTFNCVRAQGFDWHRFNITAEGAFQPNILQLGSGLLANHPDRSATLGVGYRLGQHWEVGLYANLLGANAMSSGSQSLGNGQMVRWMYVTNGYELGWGIQAQLHLVPYRMRHEIGFDMMARLGFDVAEAEADSFWAGLRISADITRHIALFYGMDLGTFYFGRTYAHLINGPDLDIHVRASIGLQVEF